MFKSEKEIHDFINNQGLFINDGELCIKTSDSEFEKLNNICIGDEVIKATDRLDEFFRFNSYPFIDLNNITIPEIDIGIINKYHLRNERIKESKEMQEQIESAPHINKKHFRLIHFDKVKPNDEHYWIYNTKDGNLSNYSNDLLSAADKKKAVEFPNILSFKRIIEDTLENQFTEQYNAENKKFEDLKINKL